jgi:hypothetical protein
MESGFNIIEEHAIDVSEIDYIEANPQGCFFHATVGGDIKYLPLGNKSDDEAVTKTFEASESYNNTVIVKKIFSLGTTASGIYIGYKR